MNNLIRITDSRIEVAKGAWLAQSVDRATLDLRNVSSNPTLG